MTLAQTTYMAASFASGWWIVMVVMMVLCMGGMMFGMSRMMGRGSRRGWWPPWERFGTRESPVETLDRRFAEGEISVEDYRARREVLVKGAAEPNGDQADERLTTSSAGEGRT